MDLLDEILLSKVSPVDSGVTVKDGKVYYDDIRIDNLVQDGNLVIDEDLWVKLNEHPRQTVIHAISTAIEYFKVKPPFPDSTLDEARDDFIRLQRFGVESMLGFGECVGRVNSKKYTLGNKFVKNEKVGRTASNFFQQDNRLRCGYYNLASPEQCWTQPKHREFFLRALWSLKYKKVTSWELRSAISLRGYIAAQFPPSVAKFFFDKFQSKKILDFSSGWGDRLCGFYASNAEEYLGLDPNSSLHPQYKKQIELYSQYAPEKKAVMVETSAEDFDYGKYKNHFDMVFTSPPYFDRERYSTDDSQSWVRYSTLESWLDGFLFKTIEGCWTALKSGGFMVINIADIRKRVTEGYEYQNICEPMNDCISGLGGEFLGCVNLKLANRPSKGSNQVQVEPIWIWRKK